MTVLKLKLVIGADGAVGARVIDKTGKSLKDFGNKAERAGQKTSFLSSTIGRMHAYLGGVTFGAAIGQLVSLTDGYISMAAQLRVNTNAQENLGAMQQAVSEISRSTGSQLAATATTYARLNRAIEDMGGNYQKTTIVTQALNDALSINRSTTAEASSAQIQFSQAIGSGVLRGEEFNSLMENATPLMIALAQELGVTTGELRGMAKEGQLTSDVVLPAIVAAADDLRQKSEEMGLSLPQHWQNIKTALQEYLGTSESSVGVNAALGHSLKLVGENIGVLFTAVKALAVIGLAKILGTSANAALLYAQKSRVAAVEQRAMRVATIEATASEVRRTAAMKSATATSVAHTAAVQAHSAALRANTVAGRAQAAATGIARGALALIGGPAGAAMLAAGAIAMFAFNSEDAKEKADRLGGEVDNLRVSFDSLVGAKLDDAILDTRDAISASRKAVVELTADVEKARKTYGAWDFAPEKYEELERKRVDLALATERLTEQEEIYGDLQGRVKTLAEKKKLEIVAQTSAIDKNSKTQLEANKAQEEREKLISDYLPELKKLTKLEKDREKLIDAATKGDKKAQKAVGRLDSEIEKLNKTLKSNGEVTGSATTKMSDYERSLESTFKAATPLRTAQAEYATEMRNLDTLLAQHKITQEEHTDALADEEEKLTDVQNEVSGYTEELKKSKEEQEKAKTAADAQTSAYESLYDELYPLSALERQHTEEKKLLIAEMERQKASTDDIATAVADLEVMQSSQMEQATKTGEKNIEVATASEKAWGNAVKSMDDGFRNLWRSGLDDFDSFGDALKSTFKNLIAELLHQATTAKIIPALLGNSTGESTSLLGNMANGVAGLFGSGASSATTAGAQALIAQEGVGWGGTVASTGIGAGTAAGSSSLLSSVGSYFGTASTVGTVGAVSAVALPVIAAFTHWNKVANKVVAQWQSVADAEKKTTTTIQQTNYDYMTDSMVTTAIDRTTSVEWEDDVYSTGSFGAVGMRDQGSKNVDASDFQESLDAITSMDDTIAQMFPDRVNQVTEALDGWTERDGKANGFASFMGERFSIILDNLGIDYLDQITEGLSTAEYTTVGVTRLLMFQDVLNSDFADQFDDMSRLIVEAGDSLTDVSTSISSIPSGVGAWGSYVDLILESTGKTVTNLDSLKDTYFNLGTLSFEGLSAEQIQLEINSWLNEQGGELLQAVMPEFSGALEGAGSRVAEIVEPLINIAAYLNEDWAPAVQQTFAQQAANSYTAVQDMLAQYDGSVESTQQLSVAVAQRYQLEEQLLQQIDAISGSVTEMTGGIKDRLERMQRTDEEQIEWLTTRQNELRSQLLNATDPNEINNLVQQITQLTGEQIGLLGEEGIAAYSKTHTTVANEISSFMEGINGIAQLKLAESENAIETQRDELSSGISEALSSGTETFIASADELAQAQIAALEAMRVMSEASDEALQESLAVAANELSGLSESVFNAFGEQAAMIAEEAGATLEMMTTASGDELTGLGQIASEQLSTLTESIMASNADGTSEARDQIAKIASHAAEMLSGANSEVTAGAAESLRQMSEALNTQLSGMGEQTLTAIGTLGLEITNMTAANSVISEGAVNAAAQVSELAAEAVEASIGTSAAANDAITVMSSSVADVQAVLVDSAAELSGATADALNASVDAQQQVTTNIVNLQAAVADRLNAAAQAQMQAAKNTDQAAQNSNVAAISHNNAAGALINAAKVLANSGGGYSAP